jgi:hypothetical protein
MTARPIDYWAIRGGISAAIRSYPELEAITVLPELGRLPAPEECPCVLVYLESRENPPERQRISAGLELGFRITFSIWVLHYSLDSLEDAVRKRDAVLSKVELALMADRKLGGAVRGLASFDGGDVTWSRPPNGQAFTSAIETRIVYEVTAEL